MLYSLSYLWDVRVLRLVSTTDSRTERLHILLSASIRPSYITRMYLFQLWLASIWSKKYAWLVCIPVRGKWTRVQIVTDSPFFSSFFLSPPFPLPPSGVQLYPEAFSENVMGERWSKEQTCWLHLCQDQDGHCTRRWGSHITLRARRQLWLLVLHPATFPDSSSASVDYFLIFSNVTVSTFCIQHNTLGTRPCYIYIYIQLQKYYTHFIMFHVVLF